MTDWVADFNKRLDALPAETADERQWHRLEWRPRASEAQLQALESRLGFAMPSALRELHLQQGPLQSTHFSDAWQTLQLFTADKMREGVPGLVEFIDTYWGGRPELEAGRTTQEIATLNADTAVFGLWYVNDNEHLYLYFDRQGRIGSLMLDQDDMHWALEGLRDIAKGEGPVESLDALLGELMERMIERLAELG